jgi:hypothetical protein
LNESVAIDVELTSPLQVQSAHRKALCASPPMHADVAPPSPLATSTGGPVPAQ